MLYRVHIAEDLPLGYFQSDFFADRGEFLRTCFRSKEAALKAWQENYLGPDTDNISLTPYVCSTQPQNDTEAT
jgi:hypothetical protein